MTKLIIIAAYTAYAAFWTRFFWHALVWWKASHRLKESPGSRLAGGAKAYALTTLDALFFGRLFMVNPALWLGEWVFHVSLLLVILRHLRFFLDPVPAWVWSVQQVGLIAGYILPFALVYILVIRLLTTREKYASRANVFLLGIVLAISTIGLSMRLWFTPNLVDVKLFALGILCFKPAPMPEGLLFLVHFGLVLVLIAFVPTHVVTAPLVMLEARKREQALYGVMHDEGR